MTWGQSPSWPVAEPGMQRTRERTQADAALRQGSGSRGSVTSSSHTCQGTNQLFLQKLPGCLSSWQHLAVSLGAWTLGLGLTRPCPGPRASAQTWGCNEHLAERPFLQSAPWSVWPQPHTPTWENQFLGLDPSVLVPAASKLPFSSGQRSQRGRTEVTGTSHQHSGCSRVSPVSSELWA